MKSNFGTVYFAPGGATRKMRPRSTSCWLWPPTPGSYQSATNSEPSGATHTSLGRNQLSRVPVEDVDDLGLVARAVLRHRIGPADARPGVAVDHLVVKHLGQQRAFIDADARRRARAGEQQVGTTPGSFRCQCCCGISFSMFSRCVFQPAPVNSSL